MRPRAALQPSPRLGDAPAPDAVAARLDRYVALDGRDRQALADLRHQARRYPPQRDIVAEGSKPGGVHVVLEGWACRYTTLRNGSRHIPALLLPGDFGDLNAVMLDRMDHGIAAITPVVAVSIDQPRFAALVLDRPNIARALLGATLVDLAVLRAWMIGLSRRSALGRVAHLICELRDRSVDIGEHRRFPFPLTQVELADVAGLTAVHTNRIVSQLRADGLADVRGGQATILDEDALEVAAEYDPRYLCLGRDQPA